MGQIDACSVASTPRGVMAMTAPGGFFSRGGFGGTPMSTPRGGSGGGMMTPRGCGSPTGTMSLQPGTPRVFNSMATPKTGMLRLPICSSTGFNFYGMLSRQWQSVSPRGKMVMLEEKEVEEQVEEAEWDLMRKKLHVRITGIVEEGEPEEWLEFVMPKTRGATDPVPELVMRTEPQHNISIFEERLGVIDHRFVPVRDRSDLVRYTFQGADRIIEQYNYVRDQLCPSSVITTPTYVVFHALLERVRDEETGKEPDEKGILEQYNKELKSGADIYVMEGFFCAKQPHWEAPPPPGELPKSPRALKARTAHLYDVNPERKPVIRVIIDRTLNGCVHAEVRAYLPPRGTMGKTKNILLQRRSYNINTKKYIFKGDALPNLRKTKKITYETPQKSNVVCTFIDERDWDRVQWVMVYLFPYDDDKLHKRMCDFWEGKWCPQEKLAEYFWKDQIQELTRGVTRRDKVFCEQITGRWKPTNTSRKTSEAPTPVGGKSGASAAAGLKQAMQARIAENRAQKVIKEVDENPDAIPENAVARMPQEGAPKKAGGLLGKLGKMSLVDRLRTAVKKAVAERSLVFKFPAFPRTNQDQDLSTIAEYIMRSSDDAVLEVVAEHK
ncbi:unnamed protein product [Amoebophrya sp. A25]|nr:unnamed protein product [Amoebophrya sp. A25]|eukprot:GSA25T00009958001.1